MKKFTPHSIENILSRSTHRSIISTNEHNSVTGTSSNAGASLKDSETLLMNDEQPLRNVARDEESMDGAMTTVIRIEPSEITSQSLRQQTSPWQSTNELFPLVHGDLSQESLFIWQPWKNVVEGSTKIELVEPHMQQSIPESGNSAPTLTKSLSLHPSESWGGSKSSSSCQQTVSYTSGEMNETVYLGQSDTDTGILPLKFFSRKTACGSTARRDSSTVQMEVASGKSLEFGSMPPHSQNTDRKTVQNTAQSVQTNQRTLSHYQDLPITNNQVLHCNTCPQLRFWSAEHLYDHYAEKHYPEKRIQCRTCSKPRKFVRYKTLISHFLNRHHDSNVYKCILCPAAFSDCAKFRAHEEHTHFGPPRRQCDICLEVFKTTLAWSAHICKNDYYFRRRIIV